MSDIIHDSYGNSKKKRPFNYIKSLHKDYCGIPTLQKDGVRHDDNQAKASILNQYFSSVFTNDKHLQPPPDPILTYLTLRSAVRDLLVFF